MPAKNRYSILENNRIKFSLSYQVDLDIPIWQIRLDPELEWLALEHRDGEKLLVTFSVINYKTGDILLNHFKTKDLWWAGLEGLHQGILFTHGFGKEGFGKHQGISAISVTDRQELWSDKQKSLAGYISDRVIVQDADLLPNKNLKGINLHTGEELIAYQEENLIQEKISRAETERQSAIKTPVQYRDDNAFFSDLCLFVTQNTATKPVLAIDYLETDICFITGFYTSLTNEKLQYRLLVFSLAGNLLVEQVLEDEVEGIGTDSFFIAKDTLILIKNRRTLLGYAL